MLRKYIPLALCLAVSSVLGFCAGAFSADQPGTGGPADRDSQDEVTRKGKGNDSEEAKQDKPKEEKPEMQSCPRVAHVPGE
jgi:hypothetical protein